MAFSRQFLFILLVLTLGVAQGRAAGGSKEQHAYETAVGAFHAELWEVAELEFDQFAQKFPASSKLPEAGLFEARAEFQQGKFAQCETLLRARLTAAGSLAPAYSYWIGEAQFQRGDWRTAAATLSAVPKESDYALQAGVEAEAALARLGDWQGLIALGEAEQAVFQRAERSDPDDELGLRGRLLVAQAHFARGEFRAAGGLLEQMKAGVLPADLEWKRLYLWCRVKQEAGELDAALPLATQLLQRARELPGGEGITNLSASVALQASVLEGLGRPDEAIEALRENLSRQAPEDEQRQAILKIAALSLGQGRFSNAEAMLGDYVARFTNAPALDAALLALGELDQRDFVAKPGQTNLLAAARGRFDQLLAVRPNSPLAGKAHLDRGWCDWLEGKYTNSLADFRKAAEVLPRSEELAVARFKYGDALLAGGDAAEALGQYQAVLDHFADFPKVGESLGAQALYQSLRAQLQLGDAVDLAGAAANMARMAADYPVSELRTNGGLLLGEGYMDLRDPTNALALFQKFEQALPHSALQPSVELAVARAYEQEQQWPQAIARYEDWLQTNTNELRLLPQALYSRAWANYQAGNELDALTQFTNFVVRFPTHELAPLAQWWVADHYWRLGEDGWLNAERNYKAIFQNTNWQTSELIYPSLMMAGRAAVARTDYAGAIQDYFQKMEQDTNCPLDLRVQATFVHGSALMKMDSPDTNNPTANFLKAATVFNTICTSSFPTNDWGARAWGEMGDCYQVLLRYDDATNAYWQALNAPQAGLAVRSQAQVGLGLVLEKKAGLSAGPEQAALYAEALENYWEVLNRPQEERELDPYWTKEGGVRAAELASALGHWQQTVNVYARLIELMPELKGSLARKLDEARQHLAGGK
jgi:tetratricopeptide (TPR) repeat protein